MQGLNICLKGDYNALNHWQFVSYGVCGGGLIYDHSMGF
jgi:hypothetical protein